MDELVKRLRAQADAERYFVGESMLYDVAADAIEELTRENKELLFRETQLEAMNDALIGETGAADALMVASKPRWIPVSEWLPEKAGHYIVFVELKCDGQKISAWTQVTWFCGEFILECPEDEESFVATVTHWMPLPEPPKEET